MTVSRTVSTGTSSGALRSGSSTGISEHSQCSGTERGGDAACMIREIYGQTKLAPTDGDSDGRAGSAVAAARGTRGGRRSESADARHQGTGHRRAEADGPGIPGRRTGDDDARRQPGAFRL